jgi:hypothetical protein
MVDNMISHALFQFDRKNTSAIPPGTQRGGPNAVARARSFQRAALFRQCPTERRLSVVMIRWLIRRATVILLMRVQPYAIVLVL